MPNLVAIPLKTNVSIVEVSSSGLIEICQIAFKGQAKVVVCDNEKIVSLVKAGAETYIYAHKIVDCAPLLIWEKCIHDVCYSHIAVKGNVVYLGAFYLPNTSLDPLVCIDFAGNEVKVKSEVQYKRYSGKSILHMNVYENSLYLFENHYPMGVIEYDVSNPFEPRFLKVRELEVTTKLQFIKRIAVTNGRMAVVSNYNDNLNLTNYLHVYGKTAVTLRSYFDNIYQNDPKYIELRKEMGVLPENVELKGAYSSLYYLRKVVSAPFASLLSSVIRKRHVSKFNIKQLSYATDQTIDVEHPIRIVDVLFSLNDMLFMIANGQVCFLDVRSMETPFVYLVDGAIANPIRLIDAGIPDAVIVSSDTEYALVFVVKGEEGPVGTEFRSKVKYKKEFLMLKNR